MIRLTLYACLFTGLAVISLPSQEAAQLHSSNYDGFGFLLHLTELQRRPRHLSVYSASSGLAEKSAACCASRSTSSLTVLSVHGSYDPIRKDHSSPSLHVAKEPVSLLKKIRNLAASIVVLTSSFGSTANVAARGLHDSRPASVITMDRGPMSDFRSIVQRGQVGVALARSAKAERCADASLPSAEKSSATPVATSNGDIKTWRKAIREVWDIVRKEHLNQQALNQKLPNSDVGHFAGCVTWNDIGQRIDEIELRDKQECTEVMRKMLSMIGDRYTHLYSSEELSSFVDGVDPPPPDDATVGMVLRSERVPRVRFDHSMDEPKLRLHYESEMRVQRLQGDASPAARAGIDVGDVLRRINGKGIGRMRTLDAEDMLMGPPGSVVRLSITKRFGQASVHALAALSAEIDEADQISDISEVTCRRRPLHIEQASWGTCVTTNVGGTPKRVAYVVLFDFNTKTLPEIKDFVARVQKGRQQIDMWIFDLRNNMGGLLMSAVNLCDYFLPAGQGIVDLTGSDGPVPSHVAKSRSTPIPEGTPIVVLVNKATASSSELMAAAFKDAGKACIVGEQTFGKNTVQAIVRLHDGGGLQLTIGRFASPKDSLAGGRGLRPDILYQGLPEGQDAIPVVVRLTSKIHKWKVVKEVPRDSHAYPEVLIL